MAEGMSENRTLTGGPEGDMSVFEAPFVPAPFVYAAPDAIADEMWDVVRRKGGSFEVKVEQPCAGDKLSESEVECRVKARTPLKSSR
jgi:hypothetical protein